MDLLDEIELKRQEAIAIAEKHSLQESLCRLAEEGTPPMLRKFFDLHRGKIDVNRTGNKYYIPLYFTVTPEKLRRGKIGCGNFKVLLDEGADPRRDYCANYPTHTVISYVNSLRDGPEEGEPLLQAIAYIRTCIIEKYPDAEGVKPIPRAVEPPPCEITPIASVTGARPHRPLTAPGGRVVAFRPVAGAHPRG
ncbi:MAG: hypothetical protein P4M15_15310 [Alphaproteobacteria bacterium]|nr:hypothetical protein [Alphaproteobacteria bacterium]